MSGRWVRAIAAAELLTGQGKPVQIGGRWYAVFRTAREFLATDEACPHQGASLGEGTIHGDRVFCPWHAWVFDLKTGACRGVPAATLATYPAVGHEAVPWQRQRESSVSAAKRSRKFFRSRSSLKMGWRAFPREVT